MLSARLKPNGASCFFTTAMTARAKQVPVGIKVELRMPIRMVSATRLDIVVHGAFAQTTGAVVCETELIVLAYDNRRSKLTGKFRQSIHAERTGSSSQRQEGRGRQWQ